MDKPMRMYQSIWIELQHNPDTEIQIYQPRSLHRRVMKALRKERTIAANGGKFKDSSGYYLTEVRSDESSITVCLRSFPGTILRKTVFNHASSLSNLLVPSSNDG